MSNISISAVAHPTQCQKRKPTAILHNGTRTSETVINDFFLMIIDEDFEDPLAGKILKNEFCRALAYHKLGESEKAEHIDKKVFRVEIFLYLNSEAV